MVYLDVYAHYLFDSQTNFSAVITAIHSLTRPRSHLHVPHPFPRERACQRGNGCKKVAGIVDQQLFATSGDEKHAHWKTDLIDLVLSTAENEHKGRESPFGWPGTDVMIFKIFSPKN
jgi:hypothetical protein